MRYFPCIPANYVLIILVYLNEKIYHNCYDSIFSNALAIHVLVDYHMNLYNTSDVVGYIENEGDTDCDTGVWETIKKDELRVKGYI